MSKILHEQFYKHQIEKIKKNFDLNAQVALDQLEDLPLWSVGEAKDYYLDELVELQLKAKKLFLMISEDLEEEIYRAEDEDEDKPNEPSEEPEDY